MLIKIAFHMLISEMSPTPVFVHCLELQGRADPDFNFSFFFFK